MLSTILLQAAGMGVAKMGATIGAGLAAIGAGIGIGLIGKRSSRSNWTPTVCGRGNSDIHANHECFG